MRAPVVNDVGDRLATRADIQTWAGAVREHGRFATVRLIETSDPTAYFDTRVVGGMCSVSPIQIYLELANGTKRERDIGESIRSRILAEAGANVPGANADR